MDSADIYIKMKEGGEKGWFKVSSTCARRLLHKKGGKLIYIEYNFDCDDNGRIEVRFHIEDDPDAFVDETGMVVQR